MTETYKYEHLRADAEYQFNSCPDALGFDVIAELSSPVSCYSDNFMPDVSDLKHVWMEIGHRPETTQWLDIKPALTTELIDAVFKTFQPND
jgi:hypothetical protein